MLGDEWFHINYHQITKHQMIFEKKKYNLKVYVKWMFGCSGAIVDCGLWLWRKRIKKYHSSFCSFLFFIKKYIFSPFNCSFLVRSLHSISLSLLLSSHVLLRFQLSSENVSMLIWILWFEWKRRRTGISFSKKQKHDYLKNLWLYKRCIRNIPVVFFFK